MPSGHRQGSEDQDRTAAKPGRKPESHDRAEGDPAHQIHTVENRVGRIGDPEYDTSTGIYIKKIRYQPDAGKIGYTVLNFDTRNRLFR